MSIFIRFVNLRDYRTIIYQPPHQKHEDSGGGGLTTSFENQPPVTRTRRPEQRVGVGGGGRRSGNWSRHIAADGSTGRAGAWSGTGRRALLRN